MGDHKAQRRMVPGRAQAQEQEELGSEVGVIYYCHVWKERHSCVPLP